MASRREARRKSRVPITKERVLRSAIGLADGAGIESLTMRRLARDLGVEAMTLYYYFANKDEILNGAVDLVVGEFNLPPPGAKWKAALRKTALSAHEVLMRHPWAASAMLSATGASPARWRYMDALLGCLREAGFSADLTDHAYHALDSHITGFTLWEVQIDVDPETLPDRARSFLQELPANEFPHLVEHIHQHLKDRDPGDEGAFAFGLDLILDGLERILDDA